jgi:NAD(P)-dependent dehydrogenase (short-subunit alcohol dehydrogenase family)
MEIKNSVAIVTGASRGIGRRIALDLAERGARICAVARDASGGVPGTLDDTLNAIRAAGGEAIGVHADVAKADDLVRIVERSVEAFGGVDILVNNAADMRGSSKPVQDYPREAWLRQFDINVHAAFSLASLVVPWMKAKGKGIIINITSSSADLVDRDLSAAAGATPDLGFLGPRIGYVATKAALNGMTNALAPEVAEHGIAVIAFDPGTTRTEAMDIATGRGFVPPPGTHGMEVPAAKVVELIADANPMRYSGRIVRAAASQ